MPAADDVVISFLTFRKIGLDISCESTAWRHDNLFIAFSSFSRWLLHSCFCPFRCYSRLALVKCSYTEVEHQCPNVNLEIQLKNYH